MKLITFLGTGRYEAVRYTLRQQSYETDLCPAALVHLLGNVSEVVAFVTDESRDKWYQALKQQVAGRAECRDVLVRLPEDEAGVWDLFLKIYSEMKEGPAVLDVTHGFRAVPVLGIAVAAFVHAMDPEAVEGVYYGAYDAKKDNAVPIWDLTPLVTLMDWTSAVQLYAYTGNASRIAELLEQVQNEAYQEKQPGSALPTQLQPLAGLLRGLSQAIYLARPLEAPHNAKAALERLEQARGEIRDLVPPFDAVADRLKADTERFVLQAQDIGAVLDYQLELIDWYAQHRYPLHAFALAREWLVTLACARAGSDWRDPDDRTKVERLFREKEHGYSSANDEAPLVDTMPDDLHKCWSQVSQIRNDILHCGMGRNEAHKARKIMENLQELKGKLEAVRKFADPSIDGGPQEEQG